MSDAKNVSVGGADVREPTRTALVGSAHTAPSLPGGDSILRTLLADLHAFKAELRAARHSGDLTPGETEQCFSGLGVMIRVVGDVIGGKSLPRPAWENGPLSEYHDWPNARIPCPKCGDTKPSNRRYLAPSKEGPERIQHSCYCGYHIYTKPLDESEREAFT